MKIVITSGCTAYNIKVDDKPIEDVGEQVIIDHLTARLGEHLKRGTITLDQFIHLFQYEAYESDDDSCEQCGDTVSRTTWDI